MNHPAAEMPKARVAKPEPFSTNIYQNRHFLHCMIASAQIVNFLVAEIIILC